MLRFGHSPTLMHVKRLFHLFRATPMLQDGEAKTETSEATMIFPSRTAINLVAAFGIAGTTFLASLIPVSATEIPSSNSDPWGHITGCFGALLGDPAAHAQNCPPGPPAPDGGVAHPMTGGPNGTTTCVPYTSRDLEPFDVQVASLDSSIGQQKKADELKVATVYCCIKFVLPPDGADVPVVASLDPEVGLSPSLPPDASKLIANYCP